MNRTFALPKPPFFRRTARPTAAVEVAPTRWANTDWAAVDWAAVDWAAVDWAAVDVAARPAGLPTSAIRASADTASWPMVLAYPAGTDRSAAPAVGPAPGREFPITVYAINEPTPGPRWKALFEATWPAYQAWYLGGAGRRPSLETSVAMLERHMPELLPTYRRLVELAGNDEVAARMLTMWDAPAFLPACSQAVVTGPAPVLCRNYDYSPDLWEQTIYSSNFTGRRVIGTGDCLWGLLDGMNDAGLAVSLTYGGRPGSGPGFAIPLVIRYLLEVATNTQQAGELLRGLPIAMSYNVTVVDAEGVAFTAFVAPGQEPEFSEAAVATNHHGIVPEFPERAEKFNSVERLDRLSDLVALRPSATELADAFLIEPLRNDRYSSAFGTLYTALYRPKDGIVEYHWPDVVWQCGFDDDSDSRQIVLSGR